MNDLWIYIYIYWKNVLFLDSQSKSHHNWWCCHPCHPPRWRLLCVVHARWIIHGGFILNGWILVASWWDGFPCCSYVWLGSKLPIISISGDGHQPSSIHTHYKDFILRGPLRGISISEWVFDLDLPKPPTGCCCNHHWLVPDFSVAWLPRHPATVKGLPTGWWVMIIEKFIS